MIRTPAHKQTEEAKLPGQIVAAPDKAPGVTKDFDRHPYLKTSTADQTLGDYYKKKMDAPKKLTFEEWLKTSSFVIPDHTIYEWLSDCWKAAQKNV